MSAPNTIPVERGWIIMHRDAGIKTENVLRRAQLPTNLIHQEVARLTIEEYIRFWRAMEEETSDALLPLRFGKAIRFESFNPAIFAAMCSPNLSGAMHRLSAYKNLIGPMRLKIEDTSKGLFVGISWDDKTMDMPSTIAALELVFLTQLARLGTRERIRPVGVESKGQIKPEEAYKEFFGVLPKLSGRQGVTFSNSDAQRPFLTASDSLWQTFKPELQRRMSKLNSSLTIAENVKTILLECLPSGNYSIEQVAIRLKMSTRTLQRQIREESTSYRSLVREVREKLACYYVNETNLSYSEIAFLIGFEEVSSFFRAFKEWTGKTPEAVRLQSTNQLKNQVLVS